MKSQFHFNLRNLVFISLLGAFLMACTKELPVDLPEADLKLKSLSIPQQDDMICDLIAGQSINVGQVVYSHVGNQLLVEYVTTNGWMLTEVHFYIGTKANFIATCTNKKAIKIGKFPYSATGFESTTKSFSIDLTGITPDPEGYFVVAHAVVKDKTNEETAFANCTYKPLITIKAKFSNNEYGESEGNRFSIDNSMWCYWLGTNIYDKNDVYPISKSWGWNETYGEATVTDDGVTLSIMLKAKEGLQLTHAFVYVGTLSGLKSLVEPGLYGGICPNYENFTLGKWWINSTNHTFTTEMKKVSFSFKEEFGNRWGWYSYLNF